MKNPKYYLLVAVAALSLSACSTDDTTTDPVPEKGGQKISFTVAEDSETRTTLSETDVMRWVPTDKVGIYTRGKNENSNILTVADVNQSPVEFIGVLENLVSKGDMFYAYYPYNAEQSKDPASVNLSIPADQTQTKAGEYGGQSHPLVAVPMEITWEKESYAGRINSARFRLLGAIVELQIYSSSSTGERLRGENIKSVKFVSEEPMAGDFTFDLTGVTVKEELPISGYELKEVTTTLDEPADVPATKEEAALVYLTIAPGTYAGDFVVTTNAAQYTFHMAEPMTFDRAVIKGLPADLAKATQKPLYAETDPIQFKDPEVKSICVDIANWNTNRDGELSYKEAAAVTDLGLVFKNKTSINSFNELQYFTELKSIENFAFMKCSSLKSITIPAGVTSIGMEAFDGCSSLTSITIPQAVSSIGEGAFSGCSSLSAFNGKYASADNRCLIKDGTLLAFAPAGRTEYTIPEGVTAIGRSAFDGCIDLTSITIPDKVTMIKERTFYGCSSLTNITIPEEVTAIRERAFEGCSGLKSITIPDKVTTIEDFVFSRCSNLTSVYCKPTEPPTLVGNYVFDETPSEMKIYVPATSVDAYKKAKNWSNYAGQIEADNSQPEHDENAPITFTDTAVKEICIAAGWDTNTDGELSYGEAAAVTDLGHVFKNKTSINSFNELQYFTELKSISYKAFEGCSSLTSINIPDGVTKIGSMAFFGCSSLTSINIPDGVTEIESDAFYECRLLTSINIPDGVTKIKSGTFYNSGLRSINIPDGVTKIEDEAFAECSSLKSIDIPDGVTEIGKEAFYECSNLTSINIPAGVTKIEASTFRGCEKLTSITIPAGVTEIGSHAFMNCRKLANNITIPDNITTIQEYTFCGCWNLTSITIPDKVTLIGENAFRDCRGLTSITIPEGVKEIKDKAFYDCSVLTDVYCKPTEPPILGSNVFDKTSSEIQTRIHVPAASANAYTTATDKGWSTYEGQIVGDIN